MICNEATLAVGRCFLCQPDIQAIERRKTQHPERPSIRISSTFFWHLTPDYDLASLPELRKRAEDRFGPQKSYGEMLVGDQVRQ